MGFSTCFWSESLTAVDRKYICFTFNRVKSDEVTRNACELNCHPMTTESICGANYDYCLSFHHAMVKSSEDSEVLYPHYYIVVKKNSQLITFDDSRCFPLDISKSSEQQQFCSTVVLVIYERSSSVLNEVRISITINNLFIRFCGKLFHSLSYFSIL